MGNSRIKRIYREWGEKVRLIIFIIIIIALLNIQPKIKKEGIASWYSVKSSGLITANGERYNESLLTCASADYKFNTLLKVTNMENKKFVIVRVTDRGNFKKKYNRILDLSPRAFKQLAPLSQGIIKVQVEVIK